MVDWRFAQRSPFAELFKSAGQSRTGTSKFRAELNELPLEEWPSPAASVWCPSRSA